MACHQEEIISPTIGSTGLVNTVLVLDGDAPNG
jgi:hypothetical protein